MRAMAAGRAKQAKAARAAPARCEDPRIAQRAAKAEADWAARHPARARDERRLQRLNQAATADFGHKRHGTAETHAKAAWQSQGAVTRLYAGGHLSLAQLGAALELQAAAEAIGAGQTIRTMSMETRVDTSRHGDGRFWEALGAVRREVTFSRWREQVVAALGSTAMRLTLAIVADDLALRPAAQRFRMRDAKARELLRAGLDLWTRIHRTVAKEIDAASLAAAQAGLN